MQDLSRETGLCMGQRRRRMLVARGGGREALEGEVELELMDVWRRITRIPQQVLEDQARRESVVQCPKVFNVACLLWMKSIVLMLDASKILKDEPLKARWNWNSLMSGAA